jgi:hypothetical protein
MPALSDALSGAGTVPVLALFRCWRGRPVCRADDHAGRLARTEP